MPTSISIKNVPDQIVERLRKRAKKNHRSLQGELLEILERAAEEAERKGITVDELYRRVKALNFSTPSESVAMIREMRDSRYGPDDERVK